MCDRKGITTKARKEGTMPETRSIATATFTFPVPQVTIYVCNAAC